MFISKNRVRTIGWKGLINDPYLDNSLAINEGLMLARKILLAINKIGLATATEFVDTITPQYISDLVCWAAIGARTAESQPHRMLASGLSMPVGFKNNTAGCVNAAVNAVLSALSSHSFLSITQQGVGAIVETEGNKDCHIILRGGASGPNYSSADVAKAAELLQQKNLDANIMIDCSHDNCNKDYTLQAKVIDDVCTQLHQESHHVMGLMIESNLVAGKQSLQPGAKLTYGQSITDGCIGWEET